MSNDPHQPEPGKGKTPPKPSKTSGEATETDLWDLDRVVPQKATEPGKAEVLPPRRTSSVDIRPKRPTEVGGGKIISSPGEKQATHDAHRENSAKQETKAPVESTEKSTPAGDDGEPAAESDGGTAAPIFSGSLTKIEKIALTALFAALILGAALAIIHFSNRIPTRSPLSEKIDYPVSGKLVEVESAETFWREPITSGENPDVVRRGTILIPVVKLKLNSKPGAIRVFFRNEEGTVVGDGISRDVEGEQELVIAATAGFNDIGMHAAYRTGEKEQWVVQVFEGPNRIADRKDFNKILETQISTDRR